MSLSNKDVSHVARLARLALTEEEQHVFRGQLEKILDHISVLQAFDTQNVPPTAHVVPMSNAWREDVAHRFNNTESILANAPEHEDNYFKVKKVIE